MAPLSLGIGLGITTRPCPIGGGAPGVGSLLAARVGSDGWTMYLDFAGLSTGTVSDPTKLSVSAAPPSEDYLGVPMGVFNALPAMPIRAAGGVSTNLNPRFDADFAFPGPAASGDVYTVPVKLSAPLRGPVTRLDGTLAPGETVAVTVAAGLVPGALAGSVIATNGSLLRSLRFAQDQFGSDPDRLKANIDMLPGLRRDVASLTPASTLPTSFASSGASGVWRSGSIIYIGNGSPGVPDNASRRIVGIDCRGSVNGGTSYYFHPRCLNAEIVDCLTDDQPVSGIVSGSTNNTGSTSVKWCSMWGLSRAQVLAGQLITGLNNGWTASHWNCDFDVFACAIKDFCGDGFHLMRGKLRQCAQESTGWDNRPNQAHTDGLIAVPDNGQVQSLGNWADMRAIGGGDAAARLQSLTQVGGVATAVVADLTGCFVGLQLTLTGISFASRFYCGPSPVSDNGGGFAGTVTLTGVDPATRKLTWSVDPSVPGTGTYNAAAFMSWRSISGYYGFDNPTAAASSNLSANLQKSQSVRARDDVVIGPNASYGATNSYAREGVPAGGTDQRYIRDLFVRDCFMTLPAGIAGALSPLLPQDKTKDYTIWPPDSRWLNVRSPFDNAAWTMGPQPAHTEFAMSVDAGAHNGGEDVVFTLKIDFYMAQYGNEAIAIASAGSGFVNSLATDMAAAIAGVPGLAFSGGVLTMSQGLVGNRSGRGNQGMYLAITRPTNASASGAHSLTLSTASAGTIKTASASSTLTASGGGSSKFLLEDGTSKILLEDGTSRLLLEV